MLRWILGAAILLGALSWSVAFADDDPWAEDRVIHKKQADKDSEEPREVTASGPHRTREASEQGDTLSEDSSGSYFGLGDEFHLVGQDESGRAIFTGHDHSQDGAAVNERNHDSESTPQERPERSNSRSAEGDSHADWNYAHSPDGDGYIGENVYGPMWGVPEDAVGLDGFSGNPYPGLMDGTDADGGHRHSSDEGDGEVRERHNHSDDSGSDDGDEVQRNHKINRKDPNEW